MSSGVERNHGAYLLRRTSDTEDAIAAKVSREAGTVSRIAVHHWLTARSKPRQAIRATLFSLYGIPVPAWDEPVPVPKDAPPATTTTAAPEGAAGVDRALDRFRRIAERELDRLESDGTMTPVERVKAMSNLVPTFRALRDLADEEQGRKILSSPVWQRLEAMIVAALKEHPEALEAVHDAIAQAVGEGP